MNNNSNCDGRQGMIRNRMDMRNSMDMSYQKKAMMGGCPQGQIMSRAHTGYDECSNARVVSGCNECVNTRTVKTCNNDCGNTTDTMHGKAIAMAYVPWQQFGCTYEPMQGLHAGTIFPELEKPFYGRRGMR